MLYDRNERSQNHDYPDDLRRLAMKAIDQFYDYGDANLNFLERKQNNFWISL